MARRKTEAEIRARLALLLERAANNRRGTSPNLAVQIVTLKWVLGEADLD